MTFMNQIMEWFELIRMTGGYSDIFKSSLLLSAQTPHKNIINIQITYHSSGPANRSVSSFFHLE